MCMVTDTTCFFGKEVKLILPTLPMLGLLTHTCDMRKISGKPPYICEVKQEDGEAAPEPLF